jgi:hypothetical protein
MNNNSGFFQNKKNIYISATVIILACLSLGINLSVTKISSYLGINENIIKLYLVSYKRKSHK